MSKISDIKKKNLKEEKEFFKNFFQNLEIATYMIFSEDISNIEHLELNLNNKNFAENYVDDSGFFKIPTRYINYLAYCLWQCQEYMDGGLGNKEKYNASYLFLRNLDKECNKNEIKWSRYFNFDEVESIEDLDDYRTAILKMFDSTFGNDYPPKNLIIDREYFKYKIRIKADKFIDFIDNGIISETSYLKIIIAIISLATLKDLEKEKQEEQIILFKIFYVLYGDSFIKSIKMGYHISRQVLPNKVEDLINQAKIFYTGLFDKIYQVDAAGKISHRNKNYEKIIVRAILAFISNKDDINNEGVTILEQALFSVTGKIFNKIRDGENIAASKNEDLAIKTILSKLSINKTLSVLLYYIFNKTEKEINYSKLNSDFENYYSWLYRSSDLVINMLQGNNFEGCCLKY